MPRWFIASSWAPRATAATSMPADGPGAEDYDAHRFMRGTPLHRSVRIIIASGAVLDML